MFELYRPSSSSDRTSPYAVYPTSLFSLGLGYALWYPEPHETGESQIGDVGYVHEGAFIRLFNINLSKSEHGVTFWKKAFENAAPLVDSEDLFVLDKRSRVISDGPYQSRGVKKKETRGSASVTVSPDAAAALRAGYTCKETQGALLVLQSQGRSEAVFSSRKLKIYMVRQHEQWCTYLRDVLGHDTSPGEVVLISGWVKTSADWAVAAFSNFASKHYTSLEGKVGSFIGLELFRSRKRVQSNPKMHRQGTKYSRGKGKKRAELDQDQSIFLKRYKLKRRLLMLKTIVARAGYDRLPDRGHGGDGGEGLAVNDGASDADSEDTDEDGLQWLQNRVVDPLDILLDYILEASHAGVAIAGDSDIECIIGTDDWPMDFATYLRRVQPPVDVENQCGTISIPLLLAREQARRLERRFVTASDLRRWPHIRHEGAGTPSASPVKFSNDRDSSNFPTKWPYIEFPDLSAPSDTLTITPFAPSADGKLLAAIAGTTDAVVWRLSDGLVVQRLGGQGHTGAICALAFSPDGNNLVSGSTDSTLTIWSIGTGDPTLRLHGHDDPVKTLTYTADGSLVASTSGDSIVKFWDARSGAPLGSFHHSRRIECFLVPQEGSKLAVRLQDGVALYEANSRGRVVQLGIVNTARSHDKITAVTISPDGHRLFVCDNRTNARVYDADSCKLLIELNQAHIGDPVTCAAFSPDAAKLATATGMNAVPIWGSVKGEFRPQVLLRMDRGATAVAFSPNGALLAAAGGVDGSHIWVWDWRSKVFIAEFTAPVSEIEDIRFLPDSRSLLTFAKGGPACLWNVVDALRLR